MAKKTIRTWPPGDVPLIDVEGTAQRVEVETGVGRGSLPSGRPYNAHCQSGSRGGTKDCLMAQ